MCIVLTLYHSLKAINATSVCTYRTNVIVHLFLVHAKAAIIVGSSDNVSSLWCSLYILCIAPYLQICRLLDNIWLEMQINWHINHWSAGLRAVAIYLWSGNQSLCLMQSTITRLLDNIWWEKINWFNSNDQQLLIPFVLGKYHNPRSIQSTSYTCIQINGKFCLSEDPLTRATLAQHRLIILLGNRDNPRIEHIPFSVGLKAQLHPTSPL